MTAAHCKIKKNDKYSSGSAIVNRSTPKDISIEEIVENNTLDFTIAKKFLGQMAFKKIKNLPPLFQPLKVMLFFQKHLNKVMRL